VDLDEEVIHVSEQLVSISYEVHEDEPKADSVRDIKLNRDSVMLLKAWRKKQAAERDEWAAHNARKESGNRVFTKEDGRQEGQEGGLTGGWGLLVRTRAPPWPHGAVLRASQGSGLDHASIKETTKDQVRWGSGPVLRGAAFGIRTRDLIPLAKSAG